MANPPQTLGSGAKNAPASDEEDDFDRDLHANDRAGQHGGQHETRTYSAFDVKELHDKMPDFTSDELKRIPVVAHGERLEQGGVYLDLAAPEKGSFRAQGSMEAAEPHLYVYKALVDYEMWNKLTGQDEQPDQDR